MTNPLLSACCHGFIPTVTRRNTKKKSQNHEWLLVYDTLPCLSLILSLLRFKVVYGRSVPWSCHMTYPTCTDWRILYVDIILSLSIIFWCWISRMFSYGNELRHSCSLWLIFSLLILIQVQRARCLLVWLMIKFSFTARLFPWSRNEE